MKSENLLDKILFIKEKLLPLHPQIKSMVPSSIG
jgi:hypothetical protein